MSSPIEQMIDKACGITPEVREQMRLRDRRSKALLAVAQTAVEWAAKGGSKERKEAKLRLKVQELIALGW